MKRAGFLFCAFILSQIGFDAYGMDDADWNKYKKILYEFENARYEGWSDQKAVADIARRLKMPVDEATTIFETGRKGGQQLSDEVKQRIASLLDGIELKGTYHPISLKGRIEDIRIDTGHSHLVAYIKWRSLNKLDLEEEACLLAHAFAKEAEIVDTLAMGAVDAAESTVFSAKLSIEGAKKISKDRIVDFADKRYIKLFEDVKLK